MIPELEMLNVGFAYNSHKILNNISLAISPGEIVSLIGPNGAGKSTLVKLAMGFLKPDSGIIRLFGKERREWKVRELARKIAYLPQTPLLPPAFTVWETVLLGRTPYLGFLGIPGEEDHRICREALKRVDGDHLTYRRVGEISGGERQRVILARALCQQPTLLLLDEPTTSLDMHHQVMILNLIHDLVQEQQLSVLVVLHDLNLASAFSDRQILIVKGEIKAQGSPPEVLNDKSITEVYGDHIMIIPGLLEEGRPAVLPRKRGSNIG